MLTQMSLNIKVTDQVKLRNSYGLHFKAMAVKHAERRNSHEVARKYCIIQGKHLKAEHKREKQKTKTKQTLWPLVRQRTIPTEGPPLVDEI
jgi:hypothetical protein